MNDKLTNTTFVAGDFISQGAVRAALDRRSQTRGKRATAANEENASRVQTSVPPAQPLRPLRRWSVATLIAGAAHGTAH